MKKKAIKKKKALIAQNPLSLRQKLRHSPPRTLSVLAGHLPQRGRKISKSYGESKKVLIALSGGIDSAVSAYLLQKQGYQVEAAFMKNWSSTTGLINNECPWLADRQEALRVAAFLGIPLHTLNFEKQYQKNVMNYFFEEYKTGRTPNPDVMCNKEIKFKLLYNWAIKNGFDFLATGHYSQIQNSKSKIQRFKLIRSADEFKDQTYFIYNIKTEQLPRIIFPIGGMKKSAVKALAKKIGLPNQGRKESMGLCFVGKIRLNEFLAQKLTPRPGPIVFSSAGESSRVERGISSKKGLPHSSAKADSLAMTKPQILGQHEGLHQFTIGQRQGVKVGGTGPYFVYKKDLGTNTLYVTNDPQDKRLFVKEIQLHSVNWIAPDVGLRIKDKGLRINLHGRYRHQGKLAPLTISKIKKDLYQVIFKQPQKAVVSGQSLVLYKGKECVGGGVIV
ncbi:MAG: tRNA 2-thiouridine(34) synthase MnmA [Patescibacteria group bacterium]